MIHDILLVIQIIIAIALTISILLQPRGSGLGKTFGGSDVSFSRRGLDKLIYKVTFVLAFLFIAVSVLTLVF